MLQRNDDSRLVASSTGLSTFAPADASRAAELKRVKALATLVLVGTLTLFVVAKLLLNVHPVFGFIAAEGSGKTYRGFGIVGIAQEAFQRFRGFHRTKLHKTTPCKAPERY